MYALVGGTYYGLRRELQRRRRRDLADQARAPHRGGATILANSPAAVGLRDLVTDGSALFWADAGGVRRLPIGGGSVTTLSFASSSVQRIGLDASYLYYAEGADPPDPQVRRRGDDARGGACRGLGALHRRCPDGDDLLGEPSAAVRSTPIGGGAVATHQGPLNLRVVTSVGFDGSRGAGPTARPPGAHARSGPARAASRPS